jgi:hypothetical protein
VRRRHGRASACAHEVDPEGAERAPARETQAATRNDATT